MAGAGWRLGESDTRDKAWMCSDELVYELTLTELEAVWQAQRRAGPGSDGEMVGNLEYGDEEERRERRGAEEGLTLRDEIRRTLRLFAPGATWEAVVRVQKAAVMIALIPERAMRFEERYLEIERLEKAAEGDAQHWAAAVTTFLHNRRSSRLDAEAHEAMADKAGG